MCTWWWSNALRRPVRPAGRGAERMMNDEQTERRFAAGRTRLDVPQQGEQQRGRATRGPEH